MTFLLLLASIAVVEYIVSRQRDTKYSRQGRLKKTEIPGEEQPEGHGLMALGQAIEREGSGRTPSNIPGKAHLKPLDRV